MLWSHIDHLAITAPSLSAGVEYVRGKLGVAPSPGGEHPAMGTHNFLLKLGDTMYLEVIAPNPAAPKPGRARWFGLDHVEKPRLATWVARTNDVRAAAAASAVALGHAEPMSRGKLDWLITIPADGSLPLEGIAPTLIEWRSEPHPASTLPESGCVLVRLEAFHPEAEKIRALLRSIGFEGAFSLSAAGQARLVAHIQTPSGMQRLS